MNKFYKFLLLISIVFMYDKFTNRAILPPPLRKVKEQPFYASKYLYSTDFINFYKNHSNSSLILFS